MDGQAKVLERFPNPEYAPWAAKQPPKPPQAPDPNIARIMGGEQVPFGGPIAGKVAPGKAPWPAAPSVTPSQPPQLAPLGQKPPLNQGAAAGGGMPAGLQIGGQQDFGAKGFGQANKSPGAGLAANALKDPTRGLS